MHLTGYLDTKGRPRLQISIRDTALDAIIDTGFTEFVLVPKHLARTLGLTSEGVITKRLSLADGRAASFVTVPVTVQLRTARLTTAMRFSATPSMRSWALISKNVLKVSASGAGTSQ